MKHVLQALEEQIALNAFYHATQSKLPVGSVVEHWGSKVTSPRTDRIDELRPDNVPRRLSQFFLTDKPDCLPALGRDADQDLDLYEVTPVEGAVGPLNYGWLEATLTSHLYEEGERGDEARERVRKYWAGVYPTATGVECLDEWLAKKIRVDRYVGKLSNYLGTWDKEVIRPAGWSAANEVPFSWTRSNHLYRGMTEVEYEAHRAAGFIRSTNKYSLPGEGTNFASDAPSAESYVNYGRDDPRRTGKATYLVEVQNEPTVFRAKQDGYYEAMDAVPWKLVTRVWRMWAERDAVLAQRQYVDVL